MQAIGRSAENRSGRSRTTCTGRLSAAHGGTPAVQHQSNTMFILNNNTVYNRHAARPIVQRRCLVPRPPPRAATCVEPGGMLCSIDSLSARRGPNTLLMDYLYPRSLTQRQ